MFFCMWGLACYAHAGKYLIERIISVRGEVIANGICLAKT